jgi:hypothetical protein
MAQIEAILNAAMADALQHYTRKDEHEAEVRVMQSKIEELEAVVKE